MDIQRGRRYLIDLLGRSPSGLRVLLVCDAGYVATTCSVCAERVLVSDPALFAGTTYAWVVKVEGFTEGEFWYWTDDAENKSKPALRSG